MKDLLNDYLDGKIDAIATIRRLSGIIQPEYAVTILTLICSITRVEQGDLDRELFRSLWLKEKKDEKDEEQKPQ